ncbi:MAG: 6-phosphogluconolactonase [candidate division KSB1 bacterium]|nr:6-phosphogluconolactonase [candidate division KSB1 bacterium]MDZ7367974.1 6-phosphogluconolactonase [candidate division KSB1 bacterium]MDZ7405597.1 6-phosphogluconolactonase [candidate division KSB1 bacterium]
MQELAKTDLRIFAETTILNRVAAESFTQSARRAISEKGRFTVALAGGNTPRAIYKKLASDYREQVDWSRVHFFWGDERYVPADHPDSNYNMAREALLAPLSIENENIHPIPTELYEPNEAARRYEQFLYHFFDDAFWPRFDLMLLGLGSDGHIVSLFPHSPFLQEQKRLVVAVTNSPKPPLIRLTLTLPLINRAAQIYFFVTGADKAKALRSTLEGPRDWQKFPAQAVQPANGHVIWWLDENAASLLKK